MALRTGRTVAELKHGSHARPPLGSHELTAWQAYESVFGPLDDGLRNDQHFAALLYMLALVNSDPKKSNRLKPERFAFEWDQGIGKPTAGDPEAMLAMARELQAQFAGAIPAPAGSGPLLGPDGQPATEGQA